MSARSIWLVGNDGSGKTTLSETLRRRLAARGAVAQQRHYHRSRVRRSLRALVERAADVSARKRSQTRGADTAAAGTAEPGRRVRGWRALPLHAFLWFYQSAMAVEARFLDAMGSGPLLYDRSWLDDLVSTLEAFRLETPPRLVRVSVRIFPARRLYYLSAGHEVEFARIGAVDLSAEVHRAKGERYEELVALVERAGAPIRRISTRSGARREGRPA